ncbi:actin-like ATPase domain-containing protein [Mollisia scopiformis]|uniref:Actin-like ATPase domain-containing protein n=1 Tax=Mollisia scopiformis TaxID=149040 RepID=A0A132B2C0_MOLSC|nr:actin-like ATPase domain-containing protein [Mollisia scopiformis]KUJ06536.1 actin-like ATPase domain-containing protein [Mollisia scopiformis]
MPFEPDSLPHEVELPNRKFGKLPNRTLLSASNRIKCILSIDYGTTYTGISYVFSNESELNDIATVQTWPGDGRDRDFEWKTPTVIAYGSENNFQGVKWGFMVEPGMKSYSWTKLLLDKNAPKGKYDDPTLTNIVRKGMMELPKGKSAQQVCEDYLREVRNFVFARLDKENGADFMKLTPMECWITVPATWLDEAQDATREAAKGAGFASRSMDSINVIPEPEAAAICALKKLTAPGAPDSLKAGEDIMICDCGGGTVDLTTYSVTATYPLLDFEELVVGEGGKCGATYIDRNLHTLMTTRFGESFKKLDPKKTGPGSKFMQSFERVKRDFPKGFDKEKGIGPLKLVSKNPAHYDDDDGTVKLSLADMQSLFDPVISQVIALVKAQVQEASKLNHDIDRIVLVGGFGDSPYLFEKLGAWCKTNGGIKLICPPAPQAAIARGAALRGLAGTAPSLKKQRRHYGYEVGRTFDEGVDDATKAYIDPFLDQEDQRRIQEMVWKIAKGENVTTKTVRSQSLYFTHKEGSSSFTQTVELYSCNLDTAPLSVEHERVVQVGEIKVDYSEVDLNTLESTYKDGKKCYKMEFDVRIEFGAVKGILVFSSWIGKRQVGTASLSFAK